VLLLASITNRLEGLIALLLFALGTAASMSVLSTVLGHVLTAAPGRRTLVRVAPALGLLSLAFGAWYTLGAVG
jgi:cytochrome c biogenesis protein CcdA